MGEVAYREQVRVPMRAGPAFGATGLPPEVEARAEDHGPLDSRTEALLGFAIVTPMLAAYGAIAYGVYSLISLL